MGVVGVLRRTAAFRGYRGMGDWRLARERDTDTKKETQERIPESR